MIRAVLPFFAVLMFLIGMLAVAGGEGEARVMGIVYASIPVVFYGGWFLGGRILAVYRNSKYYTPKKSKLELHIEEMRRKAEQDKQKEADAEPQVRPDNS